MKTINIPLSAIKKDPDEFYPTPTWCTHALVDWLSDHVQSWKDLQNIMRYKSFLEPCIGNGSILFALQEKGLFLESPIKGVDIKPKINITQPFLNITKNDFLSKDVEVHEDVCITNPPFALAEPFLRKILPVCDFTAFLLKLSFLESQERYSFFQKHSPPDTLLVLSDRPSFTGHGTDAQAYGWFIWCNYEINKPLFPRGIFCIEKPKYHR